MRVCPVGAKEKAPRELTHQEKPSSSHQMAKNATPQRQKCAQHGGREVHGHEPREPHDANARATKPFAPQVPSVDATGYGATKQKHVEDVK